MRPIILIISIVFISTLGKNSFSFFVKEKYPQSVAADKERAILLEVTNGIKNVYVDMEYFGYYYYQGGFISNMPFPSPYGGYFDGSSHPALGEKNRQLFRKAFLKAPPQGILTGKTFSAAISYSDLWNFTKEHYTLKDSFQNSQGSKTYFWQLK